MRQLESKAVTLISIVVIIWLLCMVLGCRSKQIAVNDTEHTEQIDTTKATTDSTAVERETKETTKTTAAGSDSVVFEFVDGGGSVEIDKDGNIKASGVKNLRAGTNYCKDEEKATEATEKGVQTHNDTNKGINNKKSRQTEKSEKPATPKWYENVLIKVGTICCIAAILWAVFLYIRRKF